MLSLRSTELPSSTRQVWLRYQPSASAGSSSCDLWGAGPGLLDLASWQDTTQAPDLARFALLLAAYLAAGGPVEAAASRGGLPPARWAFGWHRLWIVDWYLQQATTWIADPDQDPLYQRVITRHLTEAVACLCLD